MTQSKTQETKNAILLFTAALIWGTAFVAQSVGADHVGGFTFNGIRNIVGGSFLIPLIFIFRRLHLVERPNTENRSEEAVIKGKTSSSPVITKTELKGGILCGIVLCAASNLQQIGIAYTTTAKAGFLTALYVIIVPFFGFVFLKRKIKPVLAVCVVFAVAGLYLLCMSKEAFSLAFGDLLELLCAFAFALHILVIDHYSPKSSGVVLSCIQFFTSGIISCILMLIFENPTVDGIRHALIAILYAGIMSSGIAYTLQIIGQRKLNATIAALIMCMESVIAAISGWALLGQALSAREIAGCVLMFIAIVIATLKG